MIAAPCRFTPITQPEMSDAANAPAAGAAKRKPTDAGLMKISCAICGKSDAGMPKIIATESMMKKPSTTCWRPR